MDTYDLARWAPLSAENFIAQLTQTAYTAVEPESLSCAPFELLPDGRLRIIFNAEVYTQMATDQTPPTSENEPYLMLLHNPETGKTHHFVRSDAHLTNS